MLVHRYVGRQGYPDSDHLLIRGDDLHQIAEKVPSDKILGRVVQVVGDQKVVKLTGAIYRWSSFLWVRTYPVSIFLNFLLAECFVNVFDYSPIHPRNRK